MFTVKFWKDLGERAFNTAWQTLLALVLAGPAFNVLTFDWPTALTVVLSAVVLSAVKSLAVGKLTNDDSMSPASLVSDDKIDGV